MKILQLIQKPQLRGAEIFTCQLSNHLLKLSEVTVVALFPGHASLPFEGKIIELNRPFDQRLKDYGGWRELSDIIKKEKPDLVQVNAGDTLKYAVFSKLLFKWKQPIIVRNASTLSSYIKNPIQKIYNGFLYKQTGAIAAVSEHSKKDFLSLYSNFKSRVCTIPIGLEVKKQVKNPFPIDKLEWINLVHVGGFSFEKNHKRLLHIFSEILKRRKYVNLWLVGDGPLRLNVEEQVKAMGLQDNVHFTGFVSNPLDYISFARVLLLPSIIEGLPGVILEAMLYNTPVVAYNVGGIGEIVKSNETGWLIDPANEKAFAKAIEEVISLDEVELNKITEKARELVESKYMNVQIAAKFALLYKQILNKN